MGYLDWYRTPHTEKEHVVERYKVSPDGRMLEVLVKVEDPDTFNETLYRTSTRLPHSFSFNISTARVTTCPSSQ
jgi:hypothetical protein